MTVSLERLVVDQEPHVITEQLIREGYVVNGARTEERQQKAPFKEMTHVALSFRSIARIQNLHCLDDLTKLQLDNNRIECVENLSHLTSLTWLDLSFNRITKIEGLESLTRLTDLSLAHNQISAVEGLAPLSQLQVLSLGNNAIKDLEEVMYLRQFKNLQLVNLAGNPISSSSDYRSYVISHLPALVYLDFRRIWPADVSAAMEAHQDEMLELREREEQAAVEERTAAERAAHTAQLRAAGLHGVESLLDDLAAAEPEWARLAGIPSLLDPWSEVREKMAAATEDFKTQMLAQHELKQQEHQQWRVAVEGLLNERDQEARDEVADFELAKKQLAVGVKGTPAGDREVLIMPAKVKLMALKERLMSLEMDTTEAVQQLCAEFDRRYSELAGVRKAAFNGFFAQARDLLAAFFNALGPAALALLDKYSADPSLLDKLPEASRAAAGDKEVLVAAVQACQDGHASRLDALEDALVTAEANGAVALVEDNAQWESKRSRERISEIINYVQHNIAALEKLASDREDEKRGEDSWPY